MVRNFESFDKGLLLIPFLIIIVPTFNSVDRIGDQYFYLSIYLFCSFLWILTTKNIDRIFDLWKSFVKNPIAIGYMGILFFGLVSSMFAENKKESFVILSQLGTVFLTFLVVFTLSKSISTPIEYIFKCFYFLLLLEISISLIPLYIDIDLGQVATRSQRYMGLMSNINITAFSLLYKVPVLLYFINKKPSLLFRGFNYFLLFNLILLITIIGSRASYIGVFIFGLFLVYRIVFIEKKQKQKKRIPFTLLGIMISSILFNIFISNQSDNTNFVDRTAQISVDRTDGSINQRLTYYSASYSFIVENFFFGIGLGNWKLRSIEKVKNNIDAYVIPYYSHNDFLQIFSEIGFFGFLSYLSIYISALLSIFKNWRMEVYSYLFVFIIFYSIDSMLNFPMGRLASHLQFTLYLSLLFLLKPKKANG